MVKFWITSDFTNLKEAPGGKVTFPVEVRDAKTLIIQTYLVASYNEAEVNGSCNSDVSVLKGSHSA